MNTNAPKKSLAAAYIFAFLGGYLGLHRFYLGQIGIGIVYLLTLGVFGIGWIIDLIVLPGIVKKANWETSRLGGITIVNNVGGAV